MTPADAEDARSEEEREHRSDTGAGPEVAPVEARVDDRLLDGADGAGRERALARIQHRRSRRRQRIGVRVQRTLESVRPCLRDPRTLGERTLALVDIHSPSWEEQEIAEYVVREMPWQPTWRVDETLWYSTAVGDEPLVVLAGKEYGSGSSRDWAAKGPALQGIRAVIAESR